MKKALHLNFAFILLVSVQIFGQNTFSMNLSSGGIVRNFRLYIPDVYTGQEPRPLVFQFHGTGETNTLGFQNLTNFTKVADTANFILATPQGINFPIWNLTDWNAYEAANIGVQDVLFVSDMIDTLCKMYNIDTTRIYSSGWSSGGFFSQYLAWKLSNRIAAVGSVCGGIVDSVFFKIMPPKPVSIMEIHGTLDPYVPWAGGFWQEFWQMPVDTVMGFWVNNNGCELTPTVIDMPNTNTSDGCTAKRYVWANGECGTEVQLLKITGGQHTWPNWNTTSSGTCKDFFADVEMWRFFLNHPLGCVSTAIDEPQPTPEIAIWPNPASDFVNVTFFDSDASQMPKSLQISDFQGRVLLQRNLMPNEQNKQVSLDLAATPPGGYFLVVETAEGNRSFRRFVVVR